MNYAMPTTELRRIVLCLRAAQPCGQVRVVRRPLLPLQCIGLAELTCEGRATIIIEPSLDRYAARETLIHEWAHILAWRRHGTEILDHGDEWALAYGDTYRALAAEWARRRF